MAQSKLVDAKKMPQMSRRTHMEPSPSGRRFFCQSFRVRTRSKACASTLSNWLER